ncbi:glycosyltransferase family 2 protein [Saxibacter everestensis]|uniref:4,4'-diaponeurosporenoate glycosyltransferase n=1 Tax=Saxibacter everestensis TaxID=2909229 RepID=A0ABY8QV79_9MICO|nr:glycosyltransferase family 2 protein [Brevibacteriaceae bacterium ZFBP1038]
MNQQQRDSPRCSVVVPVRNDAVHLRRFLDALDQQSRTPDEVIVVDNASCDDSARLARDRGARVLQESRIGIPFAAATGYNAATGRVIVRADADTLPGADWLDKLLAHLDRHDDAVAVSGPGHFYGMPNLISSVASFLYNGGYVCATGLALGHPPLFGTNLAFRTSWWNQVRCDLHLGPDVHDDLDLSFRVRPQDRVVFAPAIWVGMSARPLRAGTSVRLRRGIETVRVNWRDERPWERWAARRRST